MNKPYERVQGWSVQKRVLVQTETIRHKTNKQKKLNKPKGAKFPELVDTRGRGSWLATRRRRASSCCGADAATITSHNQFSLSQACDQPLQNLQRIHYHVSGCSTSRDPVPILYDILYWGLEVGWGGVGGTGYCAGFHGSRSERTDGQLVEVRIPPPGSRTRFPVPRCSVPGLGERRGARAF